MLAYKSLKQRLLSGEVMPAKAVAGPVFFVVLYLLADSFYLVIDRQHYPGIHSIMEIAAIVIAVCASLMSWYDYKYKQELRALLLSLTFCGVAVIDLAHTFSYPGMPDFITPNSANKSSTFWIIGRFVFCTGFLAAIMAGDRVKPVRRSSLLMLGTILASLGLVIAVVLCLPHLPAMYDVEAGRQTAFKIYLEYLIMFVLGLAAIKIILKKQFERRDYHLFLALVISILSEMAFTLYHSAFDTYNLLGHIYKIIAFGFIFKAILDEAVGILYKTNEILERQSRELSESNSQLREMDRLKDEFLANTNHEMRTPLSAIIAFTELLLDDRTGKLNDVQKDYLNEINDSSKELLTRINCFLDLSKIAAGKTVLYKENFDILELIEEIMRRMGPLFNSRGIIFEYIRSPYGLTVFADREKVGQVLTNLLTNALKFTAPGGKVSVRAGVNNTGNEVFVSVSDTGIGIDPENWELIFQPFQQVDGTSVRKYGGTGIGLTLARKLMELHGGFIELISEKNKGSTFTLKLPVIDN